MEFGPTTRPTDSSSGASVVRERNPNPRPSFTKQQQVGRADGVQLHRICFVVGVRTCEVKGADGSGGDVMKHCNLVYGSG